MKDDASSVNIIVERDELACELARVFFAECTFASQEVIKKIRFHMVYHVVFCLAHLFFGKQV